MALLLCLHFGDPWGTSLMPTSRPSHVQMLSKGVSWSVLALKVDIHSFVPVSLGSHHFLFLFSAYLFC